MDILKKTPRFVLWSAVLIALSVILSFVGLSIPKSSIYFALFALLGALIAPQIKKLMVYRRDLGIVSGILTIFHVMSSVYSIFNFSPTWLTTLGGQLGGVAYGVILALLITSSYAIQRKFRKWQKQIQSNERELQRNHHQTCI